MGELAQGSQEARKPSENRLDSWKEIAAYLHRDVKTVQRWEKREGMPVHRHLHDRIGSVYAFSSELDAWVQSRKLQWEEEVQPSVEAPADAESDRGQGKTSWVRRRIVLAGVVGLALLGIAYIFTRGRGNVTSPKIKSLAVLPL